MIVLARNTLSGIEPVVGRTDTEIKVAVVLVPPGGRRRGGGRGTRSWARFAVAMAISGEAVSSPSTESWAPPEVDTITRKPVVLGAAVRGMATSRGTVSVCPTGIVIDEARPTVKASSPSVERL